MTLSSSSSMLSRLLPQKNNLITVLTCLFTLFLFFVAARSTQASPTPDARLLIKGPESTVYFYNIPDGKRYVFPTSKTFFTWYADFSTVKTISGDDLAKIPLGGNVTYRPGIKLVKITTDPKVYAVAHGGVLHWVTTEEIAKKLYGTDWNQKIDDVPDAYFVNYKIGIPINTVNEYCENLEQILTPSIDNDLQPSAVDPTVGANCHVLDAASNPSPLPPPPSTSSTPPVTSPVASSTPFTFTASKTTLQAGDLEALTVMTSSSISVTKIELFFDGNLIKTCSATPSCYGETTVPSSGIKESYGALAKITTLSTEIFSQSINIPVKTDTANLVHLHVGQGYILPSQPASAIVTVDNSVAVNRIDIYVDQSALKGCIDGAHQCQWSDYLSGPINSTHTVYGLVTDTVGRTYKSPTLTITLSTNDSPRVNVIPAKSIIYAGETVDITVTASDNDGISAIEIMKDGVVLKHCDGAAPCTATTGPWPTTGTLTFSGRAHDPKSTQGVADPQNVMVVTQPEK